MAKRTPEGGRFWNPQNQWDCSKSPWGELIADVESVVLWWFPRDALLS
jgi:hypothetical protein